MKRNKKIISKVIVVFLGIAAFIAVIITYLDSMITSGITDLLEKAVLVESEFETAHFNLLKGNISLHQLRVSSPEGSVSDNFIVIGKIVGPLSMRELFGKKIMINILEIDDLIIDIDENLLGKNYDSIFPVKSGGGENTLESGKRSIQEKTFQVVIYRVAINKITLNINRLKRSKRVSVEKMSLNGPWSLHDDIGLGNMVKDIIESIGDDYPR